MDRRSKVAVGLIAAVLLVIGAAAVDGDDGGGKQAAGAGAVALVASADVGARDVEDSGAVEGASAGGSVASVKVGELAAKIFEPRDQPRELAAAVEAARDEAGARRAAVAILELTEDAVRLPIDDAVALQAPFSTRMFADEAAAQTRAQLEQLARAVPDGIRLRLAPIEVRSEPAGDDWVVSIWFVEAITIGYETVVDDWRTATYRMRWEDGAWKVDDFESVRGPTPGRGVQPASAPVELFEAQLEGFSDEGLLTIEQPLSDS